MEYGHPRMTQTGAAHEQAERVARESYGRLLAFLAPRCGIDRAEEVLEDAFAAALERWPRDGVPEKPEAWILVAARNRFIDRVRRERREAAALERLAATTDDAYQAFDPERAQDERLAMLFACAHPAIASAMRAPLMLQIVLGIDAARIASAFLIAPATMSQRLVRAKRKIVEAGVPLRVPERAEFPQRLDAVLAAIYAAFCEGWGDPAGLDARTLGVADEAVWLGRLVVERFPHEPEALGFLALMLYAHARRNARRISGAFIPFDQQDPRLWDVAMIDEAEALLRRASACATRGRFQLEAAVQSAHAVRRLGIEPDWAAIVGLYDHLFEVTGSPVVALNRAVALSRARGAKAALRALELLASERMSEYQPYWAARADVLMRSGDRDGALESLHRAIGLTVDPAVRAYLAARAAGLTSGRSVP